MTIIAPGEVIQMDSGRIFDESEQGPLSATQDNQQYASNFKSQVHSQSREMTKYH